MSAHFDYENLVKKDHVWHGCPKCNNPAVCCYGQAFRFDDGRSGAPGLEIKFCPFCGVELPYERRKA